ncbi:peptidoglycan recognition protein family protein [Lapidilactobacillus wuchangensis]|uniref:peptidoglycan recognition protein family protein n=1 Tax=Lapidilactobacillus wuchangensis TaxID=2486001 RepID=UPI000F7A476E|nr:peptidoglycan recognition family protein [Lapidilactobacillus wuchangensis]
MKQSKKITFFCTAMLASMTLFAANDLMSNQATQAVKAATSLTVSSSINSYILSSKFAVSNVTKELHTFSMFNYSTSDKKPNGIVFHYTDNPNNYSARNEADYEINGGWQDAFVHTFIDAGTILNIHDTDFGSWGGGPKANARFVQFELVTARNREEFAKSINNAAWYTASMAVKYNWTLTPATVNGGGTLWTHYDVTNYLGGTDHTDPIAYLAKWGYDTTQFMDLAKYYYSEMANQGNFDKVALTTNGLEIRGWHAAATTEGKNHSFLIVLDADTNREIARYQISRTVRNDVAKFYPKLYGSMNSGFEYNIPLSTNITNHRIKIISRYSSAANGNSDYVDFTSPSYNFSKNYSSFDSVKRDGYALNVRGWHAADGSVNRPYHYIILYNDTDNREITRTKVDNYVRNDVAALYSDVYNSDKSGFSTSFKLDPSLSGKKIRVLSRYSDSATGNGNNVDQWSKEYQYEFNQNVGSVDSFQTSGSSIHVSGWNAADASYNKNYSFLFLMDQSGREIKRYSINRTSRPDVLKFYPNIYNSINSGFSLNIPMSTQLSGQKVTVKLRYSASSSGNSNYVDTDFSKQYQLPTLQKENKGNLDSARVIDSNISLRGWHAADNSYLQPYRYLFLMDSKTKNEVARFPITSVSRPDVALFYPMIFNANMSGFALNIPLKAEISNRDLNVMVRYSDDIRGNGNTTDYWLNGNFKF